LGRFLHGEKVYESVLMHDPIIVPSFAKVNLGLSILGKRGDGYHLIDSIFQTISLKDFLHFKFEGNNITVTTNSLSISDGLSNLVYRAAKLFQERTMKKLDITIYIDKKIPVEAGLGGGSSNAGATLQTLNRLFDYPLSSDELMEIAKDLGSDVPFFLKGGTAHVMGRGEMIEWCEDLPPLYFLLVIPPFSVSTQWAFQHWDKIGDSTLTNKGLSFILDEVKKGRKEILGELKNSFERVILNEYPQIREIMAKLKRLKPINVLLSGSGPTVFSIFGSGTYDRGRGEILEGNFTTLRCRSVSREEYCNSLKLKED